MNTCVNGHAINGPQDRLPNGHCRECDRVHQSNYRQRRKLGMELLRRMERAGLRESDLREGDGFTIALRWLSEESPRELAAIEEAHPAMIAKVRRQLSAIDG